MQQHLEPVAGASSVYDDDEYQNEFSSEDGASTVLPPPVANTSNGTEHKTFLHRRFRPDVHQVDLADLQLKTVGVRRLAHKAVVINEDNRRRALDANPETWSTLSQEGAPGHLADYDKNIDWESKAAFDYKAGHFT